MKTHFYPRFSVLLLLVFFQTDIFSQGVAINTNGAPPDNTALLDVSSTTKGVLISRMSTSQRNAISNPATGLSIYNTDINCFQYYTGSAWLNNCGSQSSTSPCTASAGVASSSQSSVSCGGSVTLTLTGYNGQIQWQQSTDGAFFSNVSGAINATASVSVSNPTMYYVARVRNGTCADGYSNVVKVTATTCPALSCTTLGGIVDDYAESIIQTSDGGYAIAGHTYSYGVGDQDMYIVKLDAAGAISWSRTVGGAGTDQAKSIVQTSDGGYMVAGSTTSYGAGGSSWGDVYFVKLDASGTVSWTKTVGGTGDDYALSVVQTSDGGYAATGTTWSFISGGGRDMYVVKLDGSGNLSWTKSIGSTSDDLGYSIVQTNDGGYAIAGLTTANFNSGDWDMYVAKLDGSGSFVWGKTIGGGSTDQAFAITQNTDGSLTVAGETRSFGNGYLNIYVAKLSSSGSLSWTRTIGYSNFDEMGNSIKQTSDGGWIVAGTGFGAFAAIFVAKLDNSGALSWSKTIGTNLSQQYCNSVIPTSDGGYALAGNISGQGAGSMDMYVVKLDVNGNSCCVSSITSASSTGGTLNSGGLTTSGGSSNSGGVSGSGFGTKIDQCY